MATEITMPKLSDTMTEGQLGVWRKSVGERIERGDIIAEVETDKATMDLEAFASGVLLEQRVQSGELVPVGTVIGLIGEAGEAPAPQAPVAAATTEPQLKPQPQSQEVPIPEVEAEPALKPSFIRAAAPGGEVSPVVRRRATEMGIDLAGLQGSGPGGRVLLEDLERHAPREARTELPHGEAPAVVVQSSAPQPLSRMRSAIARTTAAAWQSIPHFYLTREIEMDQAGQAIKGLKGEGVEVSLNALILTAAATALTAFPALNSGYVEGGRVNSASVNLSFAVALEDGLQMPVIKGAELKGLRELTSESLRLTEGARQGKLTEGDISGGSFSVSNLGMAGVDSLASIIMPGQAAIMGIGAVAERPLVRDGAVVIARMMTVTLSCDHRIVDGATAASFLNEFKRLLEHPAELPA